VLAAAACVMCASCGKDSVSPGLDETVNGLALHASVVPVFGGGALGDIPMLSVGVDITNTTNDPITLHYPAGCPVRIRLYQAGNDNLVYDQSLFPCNYDVIVPLALAPGQTRSLSSGDFFPWVVGQDSVTPGYFRAVAILRITGEEPFELEAGSYRLPRCPDPMPPCFYVGPPATIDTPRTRFAAPFTRLHSPRPK
jgi:hypothetical protein